MFDAPAVAVAERAPVGRPRKSVKTESVRLRSDVLEPARTVSSLRRIDLSEYLSNLLAPLVLRDYKAERRKIAKEDLGD